MGILECRRWLVVVIQIFLVIHLSGLWITRPGRGIQHKAARNVSQTIQLRVAQNVSIPSREWNRENPQYPWLNTLGDPNLSVGSAGRKVPFYLYSDNVFDFGTACRDTHGYNLPLHSKFKHGNDLWFAEQAKRHLWRVHDPSLAEVFIVPILFGFSTRQPQCGNTSTATMVAKALKTLSKMPYFLKNEGRDHIVLSTDFRVGTPGKVRTQIRKMLPGVIWGVQLHNWWSRFDASCSLAVPMNSMLSPGYMDKTTNEEWRTRPHSLYFQGQIDARPSYRPRVTIGAALREIVDDPKSRKIVAGAMYVATPQEHTEPSARAKLHVPGLQLCQCPQKHGQVTISTEGCLYCRLPGGGSVSVANRSTFNPYATDLPASRFGFHIRGDLPGSNRIYDLIKAGVIPIVSSKQVEVTLPFPDVVPWDKIIFRIPEAPQLAQRKKLLKILQTSGEELEERRNLMRKHAPDVLWDVNGSRVFTNILLFAARFCLDQKIPYPASSPRTSYNPKWRHKTKDKSSR
eukprot:m.19668 g.19668  ORF g.19668 m.19668 type:complete len:514 (+) comp5470_c0_seq1:303-1844(+)